jgi:hypothetical protein
MCPVSLVTGQMHQKFTMRADVNSSLLKAEMQVSTHGEARQLGAEHERKRSHDTNVAETLLPTCTCTAPGNWMGLMQAPVPPGHPAHLPGEGRLQARGRSRVWTPRSTVFWQEGPGE